MIMLRRWRASLEPLRARPDYGEHEDGNPFARNASEKDGDGYGCLMAVCPDEINALIQECGNKIDIKDRLVDEDFTDEGISDHAHVTLKYGIVDSPEKVVDWCGKNIHPFKFKTTGADVFKNEDKWVLVIRCADKSLKDINEDVCKHIAHVDDDFGEYKPHITICYMKPETDYQDVLKFCNDNVSGKEIAVSAVEYSDKDDNVQKIELKGQKSDKDDFKEEED